jgi:protein-L-isoaspartate(D-aspartate) O-methyltransferase
MWHLWRGLVGAAPRAARRAELAADADLAKTALEARRQSLAQAEQLGVLEATPALRSALLLVPRERFVPPEHVSLSADDRALPLGEEADAATISALHAYAASFQALGLGLGDTLVELGGGAGYGAAVASAVVGPRGSVTTIEIDPRLAAEARDNLEGDDRVRVIEGDAHDVELWRGATRVSVAFAVEAIPAAWIDALGAGGRLVAPVGSADAQTLTLVDKSAAAVSWTALGRVIYVGDRSPASISFKTNPAHGP